MVSVGALAAGGGDAVQPGASRGRNRLPADGRYRSTSVRRSPLKNPAPTRCECQHRRGKSAAVVATSRTAGRGDLIEEGLLGDSIRLTAATNGEGVTRCPTEPRARTPGHHRAVRWPQTDRSAGPPTSSTHGEQSAPKCDRSPSPQAVAREAPTTHPTGNHVVARLPQVSRRQAGSCLRAAKIELHHC